MAQPLHTGSQVVSARSRGFTLIELMIVVVIVGVLASLAVVGYRKLVQSSHVTEATNMVQSIRVAQEAYHSETMRYANISQNMTGSWYPLGTPKGNTVTAWGATCQVCNAGMDWNVLPVHVDGPVMFGYATQAGTVNPNPWPPTLPNDMSSVTLPPTPASDWFLIAATCDVDNSGGTNTFVLTTSFSNQVFTFNEGQ